MKKTELVKLIEVIVRKQLREETLSIYRPLSQIASEIRKDWHNVNYAAKPYLDAMATLHTIKDNYYEDSGASVVAYFLSNAGTWKGPVAQKVKKELNLMLKRPLPVMKSQTLKGLNSDASSVGFLRGKNGQRNIR